MKDSEISRYLNRIKLQNCGNTLEDLKLLQQKHIQNIAFENLDVVVGREIKLDYNHLFKKIVSSGRGGYCFELNILYSHLLKSLGFSIKPVLGRVWLRNPERMPPRNHLAFLVKLKDETFITDVGFGGLTTRIPLNINNVSEVNDSDGLVRILPFDDNQYMVQRMTEKGWANQYSFEEIDISKEDIHISNYYMSTNPNSHFFNDSFIGKFTENGRIGLFNNQMSTRSGIEVIDRKHIAYGSEWVDILKQQFDLELDFTDEEFNTLFKRN